MPMSSPKGVEKMSGNVINKVNWVANLYDALGIFCMLGGVVGIVLGIFHPESRVAFVSSGIAVAISGILSFAAGSIIQTFGDIEVNTQTSAQDQKAMGILMLEVSKNLELVAARLDEMSKSSEEIDKHLCAGINWFGENLPKMLDK